MRQDALKGSLLQPGFGGLGEDKGVGASLIQPLAVVPVLLHVDQIDFYQHNPRRADNARYEEIKASIRERGLDHSLPVSRTEGSERHFVYKGGNTRLRALKALWDETGDRRFALVRCDFHPFAGHTEGLAAHLRENAVRGDMSFIDTSRGIMDLRKELELEGGERLSLRALESELGAMGLPSYSAGHLSKMEYAVALESFIPVALAAGMGSDQTVKLRKLENAGREVLNHWLSVWQSEEPMEDDAFRVEVFGPALGDTDRAEGWRYDEMVTVLLNALEERGVEQAGDFLEMALSKKALPLPSTAIPSDVLEVDSVLGRNSDECVEPAKASIKDDVGDQDVSEPGLLELGKVSTTRECLELPTTTNNEVSGEGRVVPGSDSLGVDGVSQEGQGAESGGQSMRLRISRGVLVELQDCLLNLEPAGGDQYPSYEFLTAWFEGLLSFKSGDSVRWDAAAEQWEVDHG